MYIMRGPQTLRSFRAEHLPNAIIYNNFLLCFEVFLGPLLLINSHIFENKYQFWVEED